MASGQRLLVLWGLLTVACVTRSVPAGRARVITTAVANPGAGPEAYTDPSKAPSGKAGSVAPTAPLDLQQFRPLLATPELSPVREAMLAGQHLEAATRLETVLRGSSLKGTDLFRHQYLLGVLNRRAGLHKKAVLAFDPVSRGQWLLADDARMHIAELRLELKESQLALDAVSALSMLGQSPRALQVKAVALAQAARHEEAAEAWQRLLDVAPTSSARLERARALLAWAESSQGDAERQERATLASSEAHRARLGVPTSDPLVSEAQGLQRRALQLGARGPSLPAIDEQLEHLRGLAEKAKWEELETSARAVQIPGSATWLASRCELAYLTAKALAGQRKWGEAADRLQGAVVACSQQANLHPAILFNAGKYAAADGRHTRAVSHYGDLERLYPTSSLADDARLRTAQSYEKVGARARFIELLAAMPEDYPSGDMTMEGVLLLALAQMEKHDWSAAAAVLERAARLVRKSDSARGHEYAGTERYFLARCMEQLGQEEDALSEYASIVRDVPLSYYMLHAYSRLLEADPARAAQALAQGLDRAKASPFEFPYRAEYDTDIFRRGMELLRVGETEQGQRVLAELGLGPDADASLLWGIALLYDRAGDAHQAHGIARGRLTDWLSQYPEGDWRSPWEIGFPRPYHAIVAREATSTQVPEWFIYGVMREESTFLPEVVSHADAYGLMQIIPSTARGIGKKAGLPYSTGALKRPSINIAIGSRVLEELARRFKENPWLAIPGYNAGPGRPARWLRERPNVDFDMWVELIPYRETRRYTKRVLASRAAYAFLYYRATAQTALVLPKRLNVP